MRFSYIFAEKILHTRQTRIIRCMVEYRVSMSEIAGELVTGAYGGVRRVYAIFSFCG